MKKVYVPQKIDVLILCGGEGKRLKSIIKDVPKPMAGIGGRPFLDFLIDYAARFGFRRFILCSGYKGEVIRKYYRNKYKSFDILVSHEKRPLGTAGAVKNAESAVRSNPFLIMNGDSFCPLDLSKFIDFHREKRASFSIAIRKAKGSRDYGTVRVDHSGKILSFNEKAGTKGSNFINAGIYLADKSLFLMIEAGKKLSLEYDIFPGLVESRFYGYMTKAELMDIGTPDRYARVEKFLDNVF
jgi:NDP-sugar pyrophosphorylase family protein